MSEFTASNGVGIRVDNLGDLDYQNRVEWIGLCGGKVVEALREFFQHERDEELGRWRWPDNPDYVVYLRNDGRACVFNEATGVTVYRYRGEHEHLEELRRQSGEEVMPHTHAARAYFEAHPERKPWEDAKPGEVWELTLDDESEHTVFVHEDRVTGGRDGVSAGGAYFAIDDGLGIVAGRRVFPESD